MMADLKAKAKPCSARNTPIQNTERTSAQPKAPAAKSPQDTVSSVFLLSLSEMAPLTGRMTRAAVASMPAKKPATGTAAPSSMA